MKITKARKYPVASRDPFREATLKTIGRAIGRDYCIINKALVRAIGDGNAGLVLGFFMDIVQFKQEIVFKLGGWFYCKVEKLERELGFTRHVQRTAIDRLINMGFVNECRIGIPSKRYFQLNNQTINDAMDDNQISYGAEEDESNGEYDVSIHDFPNSR